MTTTDNPQPSDERIANRIAAAARREPRVAKAIAEQAGDAVLLVRDDFTIAYANYAVEAIFGYTRTELIDKKVDILVPVDRLPGHLEKSRKWMEDPHTSDLDVSAGLTARCKDGTEIPIEVHLEPIKFNGRTMVVTVIRKWETKTPHAGWPGILERLKLKHVAALGLGIVGLFAGMLAVFPLRIVYWVANVSVISIGVGLLLAYVNAVTDAVRNRRRGLTAGHLLAIGLWLNWLGIVMRQGGRYITGDPPLSEYTEWWLIALVLSIVGGLLHIAAVESVESAWAPRYFIVAAIVGIALTLVLALLGLGFF
jgi:PAS domain S-box-containing protein